MHHIPLITLGLVAVGWAIAWLLAHGADALRGGAQLELNPFQQPPPSEFSAADASRTPALLRCFRISLPPPTANQTQHSIIIMNVASRRRLPDGEVKTNAAVGDVFNRRWTRMHADGQ